MTLVHGDDDVLVPETTLDARGGIHVAPVSISVVIAWVNPLPLLLPGLEALAQQRGHGPDEIIVVTRRGEAECLQLKLLHPAVIVLAAPPNAPITALRSMGIRHARGEIIAITEDHCVPCADWTTVMEQRIGREGFDVVGGPVENASTAGWRDWAAFLTEYAGAVRPAAGGARDEPVPGNNVAYRRALADGLCTVLERGQWESFYLDRARLRVISDTRMLVYHRRPFGFRYFVSQRFHFCRSFAAMRCQSLSVAGRVVYGVGSVLLPFVMIARGLLTLERKRRLVGRYLACLPVIAVYVSAGAIGEMVGYFRGGGDSLVRLE
jgi:glycosyltransferase involved in cell wall biosynthesis